MGFVIFNKKQNKSGDTSRKKTVHKKTVKIGHKKVPYRVAQSIAPAGKNDFLRQQQKIKADEIRTCTPTCSTKKR